MNTFLEHLSVISEAHKSIDQARLRIYELKGKIEAEQLDEDRRRMELTLKTELQNTSRALSADLKRLTQSLDKLNDK